MAPTDAATEPSLQGVDAQRYVTHVFSTRSVATHTAIFVGIAAVVVFVILTVSLIGFYFYWQQKRNRLEKLQRKAIRHMTLVGPMASPYGPFDATGESSFFRTSYDDNLTRPSLDHNVPATPPPTYSPHRDRGLPKPRTNSNESLTSTVATKKNYPIEGDRMVLVNGVYVVALDSDTIRE